VRSFFSEYSALYVIIINSASSTYYSPFVKECNAGRLPDALDLSPGVIFCGGGRGNKGIYARGFSYTKEPIPVFYDRYIN